MATLADLWQTQRQKGDHGACAQFLVFIFERRPLADPPKMSPNCGICKERAPVAGS